MSEQQLAPCPFCGWPHASIEQIAPDDWSPRCRNCGVDGPGGFLTHADAAAWWNDRAPAPDVERLRALCEEAATVIERAIVSLDEYADDRYKHGPVGEWCCRDHTVARNLRALAGGATNGKPE